MVDIVNNSSKILGAIEAQLNSDTRTKSMVVKRMGVANVDPRLAQHGWVGLYADSVTYGPHTLGTAGRSWEVEYTFRIIVQAVHRGSGALAHERLEEYIKIVLDVFLSDTTLSSNVDKMDSMNITYDFFEEERETLHFEGALIVLQFTGRTQ